MLTPYQEGWSGKRIRDKKTGQITYEGGLKMFLTDPWTLMDA
jgi:hypothetical protein